MILTEIKEYLIDNRVASLTDLSVRFHVDPVAMRGMLDHWVKKGKLRKLPMGTKCSNCCAKCDSENLEIYEWYEKEN